MSSFSPVALLAASSVDAGAGADAGADVILTRRLTVGTAVQVSWTLQADLTEAKESHEDLQETLTDSLVDNSFTTTLHSTASASSGSTNALATAIADATGLNVDFSESGDGAGTNDDDEEEEEDTEKAYKEWIFIVVLLFGLAAVFTAVALYNCSCSAKQGGDGGAGGARIGELNMRNARKAGLAAASGATGASGSESLFSKAQGHRHILQQREIDDDDYEISLVQTDTGFHKQRIPKKTRGGGGGSQTHAQANSKHRHTDGNRLQQQQQQQQRQQQPQSQNDPFTDMLNPLDDGIFNSNDTFSTSQHQQQQPRNSAKVLDNNAVHAAATPVLDIFADEPVAQTNQPVLAQQELQRRQPQIGVCVCVCVCVRVCLTKSTPLTH